VKEGNGGEKEEGGEGRKGEREREGREGKGRGTKDLPRLDKNSGYGPADRKCKQRLLLGLCNYTKDKCKKNYSLYTS